MLVVLIQSFDISSVTAMATMFNCPNLINLDLRNADFLQVENYTNIFWGMNKNIVIHVKNEENKTWIEDKLGSGVGTVEIA